MTEKRNTITNVKLEINGEWYETTLFKEEPCGCSMCELHEYCDKHVELYKFCTHLHWHLGFKKLTGKSLEEARFFHG